MVKIHPKDFKYLKEKPEGDENFSEARNNWVISETIRKNDLLQKRKKKDYDDLVLERADAAKHFLKALVRKNGPYDPKRYFGASELARLRGEEIKAKIMSEVEFFNSRGELLKPRGRS